jgi:large subunit ribosomal protein L6
MSRKGRVPITILKGAEVKVEADKMSVKGPKGLLTLDIPKYVNVAVDGDKVVVSVDETREDARAIHGLYRSLIDNMVVGTTKGFEKKLEMIGVGYRAAVKGNALDVQVGYSHPVLMDIPQGINVKVEKNTVIIIDGIDKQAVGQFAASVRAKRPPEPYQGKGIRYSGEYVRRKAGKTASK